MGPRLRARHAAGRALGPAAAGLLRFSARRFARSLPLGRRGAATAPDVARLYLNVPVFAACGFMALIGWAAVGLIAGERASGPSRRIHRAGFSRLRRQPRRGRNGWLSIDPSFSDSAFGAEIAVQQIMLALAAIAAFQPRRAVALADGDVGGLLLSRLPSAPSTSAS